ncbi:unnamed protein product [Cuscuta campestris]|uniref:Aluminum-activated malate transporter n=1 Tax=Cuscuta campestris TaxID=132261 RepID=A0A484KBX6_9ASTE|nr:unnamed protein product [Cuscuta campestris]
MSSSSSSSSVVVSIPNDEDRLKNTAPDIEQQQQQRKHDQREETFSGSSSFVSSVKGTILTKMMKKMRKCSSEYEKRRRRKMVHSFKVGVALVLVSLLYVLDPLFHQVGQNVMWAIMTVVVVFEFYAGATISKGINRGIGTILGGLLGCLAAFIARKLGGFLHGTIVVAIAVFIVGVGATYVRMMPRIKRKYDYGALIFILTFNLVVVSGVRADKVILLARDRLSNIGMGFAVCVLTSLLLFPQWASDQLHSSTSSTFLHIASSLQGCLDEYMAISDEKKSGESADVSACKRILYSKANDESLANFAK